MKNKNFLTIIIASLIIIVFVGCIIYLVSSFSGGKKDKGVKIEAPDIMKPEERMLYTSKLKAYEQDRDDSIQTIKRQNVEIKLGEIFDDNKKISEKEDENYSGESIEKYFKDETENQVKEEKPQKARPSTSSSEKKVYKSQIQENLDKMDQEEKKQEENTATQKQRRESFYSSTKQKEENNQDGTSSYIKAVIHTQQKIKHGSTVRMRITENCKIGGQNINANTIIYGVASIGQERVNISIRSINSGRSIITANMAVYDNDGIEGIYIPGLVRHEAARESVNEGLSGVKVDLPVVKNVPVNVTRKENQQQSATLTNEYRIILK